MANGNVTKELYNDGIKFNAYTPEQVVKIESGKFPIILVKNGTFTYMEVGEADLENYSQFSALDSDIEAQKAIHGEAPFVWDGEDHGETPHKEPDVPTTQAPAE